MPIMEGNDVAQRHQVWQQLRKTLRKHSDEDKKLFVEMLWLSVHAEDEEEAQEAFETMVEILAVNGPQGEGATIELPLPPINNEEAPRDEKLRKWTEHVAKRIKALRNKKGWNQEELARRAGISQSHVCRIEQCYHAPAHKTIRKLAEALGVSPSEIDPV